MKLRRIVSTLSLAALTAVCLSVLSSTPASAQGKKKDKFFGGARFELNLGAFASRVETEIRLDAAALPGTTFSFENDLGLSDNETVPIGGFVWRIGRRSSLNVAYFDLNRSGTSESRISITIPDPDNEDETITIQEDVVVDSLMDTSVAYLAYRFSFINNPKAEFGLRVGLHVTGIKVGLALPNDPDIPSTDENVTAPLPTIGIYGGYRILKQLYFTGDLGYFQIEIGDFDGRITSANFGLQWQPFKLIGFGLNYQLFEVDVEASTEEFGGIGGKFKYRYDGPVLYVALRF
jgi:hypothetical protein